MSYQRERDQFIGVLAEEGVPVHVSRLVLRDATTIARLAELRCMVELTDKQERQNRNAEARIAERVALYGIKVITDGDPRGCTTKLLLPSNRYNTWGGKESGWGVPTRY